VKGKGVFPVEGTPPVLDADCGGHGCALEELIASWTRQIMNDPFLVRPQVFVSHLAQRYQDIRLGSDEDAQAVIKAALVNRRLRRREPIPGGKKTPDEVIQFGLIHFDTDSPKMRIRRDI
jgi:hypothetical protein